MIDRTYMSAHVGRQQREREIRTTTAPIRGRHRSRSETAASLAAIAWVGAYAGGGLSFVVVALVMSTVCITQFVLSRRPM